MDSKIKSLLQTAICEIKVLRSQNEVLQAKVTTFEKAFQLFNAQPPSQGGGMSPDVVWELQKEITADELNNSPTPMTMAKKEEDF